MSPDSLGSKGVVSGMEGRAGLMACIYIENPAPGTYLIFSCLSSRAAVGDQQEGRRVCFGFTAPPLLCLNPPNTGPLSPEDKMPLEGRFL